MPPNGPIPSQLYPPALGAAVAVLGLGVYLSCALVVALWPAAGLIFFDLLLHGLDLQTIYRPELGSSQVVAGTLVATAVGYLLGYLLAALYNRLALPGD